MAIHTQAISERVAVDFERLFQQNGHDATDLKSVLSTAELSRRPSRPPDHAGENRALIALVQELATSSHNILRKIAEAAMALCRSHSAGISLLNEDKTSFHWPAIVGKWTSHQGSGTPRDYGPCGTVLDRNVALLDPSRQRFHDDEPAGKFEDGVNIGASKVFLFGWEGASVTLRLENLHGQAFD
jgi:hypothetical protein